MSTIKVTNLQNASAASPAIVLDANSRATLNGLSYPTEGSLSGRNRIINGSMTVDQRNAGAAQTITAGVLAFTVDRFAVYNGGGSSITTQRVAGIGAFQNALRITGSGGSVELLQRIESANCYDLASSQATLSMYLVASANCTVTWYARHATSADNFGSQTSITTGTFNVTTTPTLFTAIITLPAGAANGIQLGASATLSAAQTLSITGVQLEAGSVATPFERRSYGQELLLAQRYFETSYPAGTAVGAASDGTGAIASVAINTTDFYNIGCFRFSVKKRTSPTLTAYNPVTGTSGQFRGYSDGSNGATVNFTWVNDSGTVRTGCASSNMTTNYIYGIHFTASAEL